METYLQFIILGLGAGVIFAGLALGLVMTHRASGVVNFAHGAIAAYAAYTFAGLATDGVYPIPPVINLLVLPEMFLRAFGFDVDLWNIPTQIEFAGPWPTWAAVVGALVTAGIIGFLFHYLVFRLLRYQPPLARVVASVGLMIMLQAAIVIRFGTGARTVWPPNASFMHCMPRQTPKIGTRKWNSRIRGMDIPAWAGSFGPGLMRM